MSLESIHKALSEIEEREKAATKGPWRSLRDGNQYIETRYIPTAKCVGASRIEEIRRPWNPHQAIAFGIPAEKHEVARFLDADGDFIAHSRQDLPNLIEALRVAVEYIEADMDSGDPVIRFTAKASLLHISSILSEGSHAG